MDDEIDPVDRSDPVRIAPRAVHQRDHQVGFSLRSANRGHHDMALDARASTDDRYAKSIGLDPRDLGIALHREPRKPGLRLQTGDHFHRLRSVALAEQRRVDLQVIEDPDERAGVSVRLVDPRWLERIGIEEQVAGHQYHQRHRVVTEGPYLSGKPVDPAERAARAAARFEIALEVRHDGQAQSGARLRTKSLLRSVSTTASAHAEG